MKPKLSVVILTLNEADNIEACLASLADQTQKRFETILIDAASDDGTVARAEAARPRLAGGLRIHADPERLPIGAARNLGVRMAKAPHVAFLSADAHLHPQWVKQALAGLRGHDMVFSRQLHAPHRWTTAAAVRGMRYHFPAGPAADPLPYASNVAAAYRRTILERFPFDDDTNAAEDLLLARRAAAAGHSATYDPEMLVYHRDVSDWRGELRKNVREGGGWAGYRDELGLATAWLAWGAGLAASGLLFMLRPRLGLATAAGVLWAPTLRRLMRHRARIPPAALARGAAASPVYDVAFLVCYLRGLARDRRAEAAA